MDHPPHPVRPAAFGAVSARLSLLSDRRLRDVVASATTLGSGVGGRTAEFEVDGTPVFVKRIPLTDIETRPENVQSTANVFGLPAFYQYGVGSSGFGAWRELAVHALTTGWVLDGACADFPLMYHWRVLPDTPPSGFADEFGGIDGAVAHWEGSSAVRARLEAIGRSAASVVVFLEHLPQTLAAWLADHRERTPGDGYGARYAWAEEAVMRTAAFMRSRGLVHFDAHFDNVLTDGRSVRFADFGLALSTEFELSPAESAFLAAHRAYDSDYLANHLLRHHLPTGLRGGLGHEEFLRRWLTDDRPEGVAPEVASVIDRHAPRAVVVDGFQRRLVHGSRRTPYPAAAIERAGR
ncbi:protein kinase family protein [Streptomyces sp. NPDC002225]|uniref:protein kinase family protein n=1 Tax=Streptomyces sp. NPDC002225 TaxID=3154413 RepID=UPI0033344BF2